MKQLLKNAKVYTVNPSRDWAEAIVIEDDKILFVGSNEDAAAFCDDSTAVTDLEGKLVLPGFIEGHIHPFMAAAFRSGVELAECPTKENLMQTIRDYVQANPDKDCYFGQGWLEPLFDSCGPTKEELDAITEKPTVLISATCHTCWANTAALKAAGITRDTPDPIPGAQFFMRDKNGEPTGYCLESSTMCKLFYPGNQYISTDGFLPSLKRYSQELASEGITACAQMGCFEFVSQVFNEKSAAFVNSDEYCGRIAGSDSLAAEPGSAAVIYPKIVEDSKKYNTDKLKVNFFKIISDGTIENGSAACPTPYPQTGLRVKPVFTEDEEFEYMMKCAADGLDINIHAIGSDAIHNILMAAGRVRAAGQKDIRITMSHSQYVYPEELGLFAKNDVFFNTTPVWLIDAESEYRYDEMIAQAPTTMLNTIKKSGARFGFGSDAPTNPRGFRVLDNIEAGMTRQELGQPDSYVDRPEERLNLEDMIAGYTINNAYQMRMEDKIGSIEAGKYADLTVLDKNLFELDKYEIHTAKVLLTMVGGRVCYQKDNAEC